MDFRDAFIFVAVSCLGVGFFKKVTQWYYALSEGQNARGYPINAVYVLS